MVLWGNTHLTACIARSQRDGRDEQRRDQCSRGKHSDCLLHDSNFLRWPDQTGLAAYGLASCEYVRIATTSDAANGLLSNDALVEDHKLKAGWKRLV